MLFQYYHFTRWANSLVINALNDIERDDTAEYLISHILNSHRIWNARAMGEKPSVLPFDAVGRSMWDTVDRENYQYSLHILREHKAADTFSYENSKGEPFEMTIEDTFLHLGNHSTHHRGQVVARIREAGFTPPITDYIAWVRAGKPIID
jgi:uncharacterized damage-inducible protein DinB